MRVVVRLPNWLGDTVMAVPLLRSLRAALGDGAPLAVAGPWAAILAGQQLCDSCITYPRSWAGRLRMADTVACLGADVAVLLPRSFESALSAWYWRARRRIGHDTDARGWLLTDRVPLPAVARHQVDEYLDLLSPLGVDPIEREPWLRSPADSPLAREATALLDSVAGAGSPTVGVHLGATFGPAKTLPPERVAALCRELSGRGLRPVLLGSPADRPLEAQVRAYDDGPRASLVGQDSLELLPALLARLDGLVSGDTGVAHLAAALGTPTVVAFGPTDPARSAPRGPVSVVAHPVACAPCAYRTCPIDHPCLRGIPVAEIADRVQSRLRSEA